MKTLLKNLKTLAVAGITTAVVGATALPAQAEPSVQLGAVAQRYPWCGTLDVSYKASGLPIAGTNATVTVAANGNTYSQNVTIVNGTNSVTVTTLPKELKAKDAKVTLKIKD